MDILLDTCVVQSLNDKHRGPNFKEFFSELINNGYHGAISEFTIYELTQGARVSTENHLLSSLEGLKRYQVDTNVLVAAARVRTIYDMEHIPGSQISDGDKIIAATSILTGSQILTENVNDFPRPFFIEVERKLIIYTYKNTQRMIPVYVLAPEISLINTRFNSRPKT